MPTRRLLIDCTRLSSGGGRTIGENLVATLEADPPRDLDVRALVPASYAHGDRVSIQSPLGAFLFYSRTLPALFARHDLFLGMSNWGIRNRGSAKRRVVYLHQPWAAYDVPRAVVERLTLRERLTLPMLTRQLRDWRTFMDALIVQTGVMRTRIVGRYGIPPELVAVIPPPIASSAAAHESVPGLDERLRGRIGVAYITAYYAHKNLEILPRAARLLKDRGVTRFVFVLTLSEEERRGRARGFEREVHQLGVAECFEILGRIPSATVAAVVKRCGIALNVAEIESFTGSILDTIAAGVPLVCSDRDFFTSLCESGFFVCEPSEPESIVAAIEAAARHLDTPLRVRGGVLDSVPSYRVFADRILDVVTAGS